MKDLNRIIGEYDSGKKGPLLFITAGVHGNEPSGVIALQKVFKTLHQNKPAIDGKIVGVSGNLKALKNEVRYIDQDLNRTWTEENVKSGKTDTHEKKEMFDIIELLKKYPETEFSKRYFLDCHTTSSDSEPYISVQDVHDNFTWSEKFPTYIIRGFSDMVEGCIDHYLSRIGITGFVFEGGQHDSETSIGNHTGMIWLCIQQACNLKLETLEQYPDSAKKLEAKRKNQKIFELAYRHEISGDDQFEMKPGFMNFQKIEKGQLLAHQNGEPIYSDWDAHIFMPLYQSQGNDGFFVVEEV